MTSRSLVFIVLAEKSWGARNIAVVVMWVESSVSK